MGLKRLTQEQPRKMATFPVRTVCPAWMKAPYGRVHLHRCVSQQLVPVAKKLAFIPITMFLPAASPSTLPSSLVTNQASRLGREGTDLEVDSQIAHVSSSLSYKSVDKFLLVNCMSENYVSELHLVKMCPDDSRKGRK